MTSQQNGTAANGKMGHTAKRSSGRVVPAIPFSLIRPAHQVKSLPKQHDGTVKAATALTGPQTVSEQGQNGGSEVEQQARGVETQEADHSVRTEQKQHQEHEEREKTRSSAETAISRGSAVMSLSNGSTPEHVASQVLAQRDVLANGQAAASSPATTSSPTSGRFDMRQTRAELPPAFIPSTVQELSVSAASSQRRPSNLFQGLPIHPGTSNLVFGGNESTGSSPAPPPGAGSAFVPPPTMHHGHAHHASVPHSQRSQNGNHATPSCAARQVAGPHRQSTTHVPFHYSSRDNFAPNGHAVVNGYGPRSRSGSHASSRAGVELQSPLSNDVDRSMDSGKVMYPDSKPHFANRHFSPSFQQHMQPAPPNFPHPEMAAGFENAESMRDHVLSHFQNPALTDCKLLVLEQDGSARSELDCHRLILARSPRLLEIIINNSEGPHENKSQVQIQLTGPRVRTGPFVDAVRYLYGGQLPPYDLYNLAPTASTEDRVEVALQYIATGAWLKIHAVAQRGVEIASSLLQWDTITRILAFALDGGLGQGWPIEYGSEKMGTSSSNDHFAKPEAGGSPIHEPHSSALLGSVLEFAVHNLPPNFYMDSSAPQSDACPRLPPYPQHHESKTSLSDPRLSKIRFGEMSNENDGHQRPSFATTIVSSILLSLPFPLLKCLLEHPALAGRLGTDTVGSIMRQVVHERENRRRKTLKNRNSSRIDETADYQQVQNLYWEEVVEPSPLTRAGLRLARRRRGIDTPPSSADTDVAQ